MKRFIDKLIKAARLFKELKKIEKGYLCVKEQPKRSGYPEKVLLLGVKKNKVRNAVDFSYYGKMPDSVKFYIGDNHLDVFKAYVKSSIPENEIDLFVGHSTDCYEQKIGRSSWDIDYSEITQVLSEADFPKVKRFRLGVSELFENGPGIKGSIGNVTNLLKKMPNVECLELGGYFLLDEPLNFSRLQHLSIKVVDYCETDTSKEPCVDTLSNIFLSSFPQLKSLYLDLNCEGNFSRESFYEFPQRFLDLECTQNLESLYISGLFRKGETQKLKSSLLWSKIDRKDEHLTEAYFLAVDVQYEGEVAFVCGVSFSSPIQERPDNVYYTELKVPDCYVPGEFYKRELPCIVKLLEEHDLSPGVIIVDGYTYLDNTKTFGLGAKLSAYFSEKGKEVLTIGVAKNPRKNTPKQWQIYRGNSTKPLFVSALGMNNEFAINVISNMAGEHRIPKLLKLADTLCRRSAKGEFPPPKA